MADAARAATGLAVPLGLTSGCMGGGGPAEHLYWTREQAESIDVVRGLSVHVHHCRGMGTPIESRRYRRFRCLAGARADNDPYPFETVAVLYVLSPLAPHTHLPSRHRLTQVRFVGGPGIP